MITHVFLQCIEMYWSTLLHPPQWMYKSLKAYFILKIKLPDKNEELVPNSFIITASYDVQI